MVSADSFLISKDILAVSLYSGKEQVHRGENLFRIPTTTKRRSRRRRTTTRTTRSTCWTPKPTFRWRTFSVSTIPNSTPTRRKNRSRKKSGRNGRKKNRRKARPTKPKTVNRKPKKTTTRSDWCNDFESKTFALMTIVTFERPISEADFSIS